MSKRKLSPYMLFLIALIGLPRVVAHDLQWVEPGSLANMFMVFVPPILWIAVVLASREERPFQTLILVGVFYGIQLGVAHQLLWHAAFEKTPSLGGNLTGLAPAVSEVVVRGFAFVSSLTTGTIVGLIAGTVGVLIHLLRVRLSR